MKPYTPFLALALFFAINAEKAHAINEGARNCDQCVSRCNGQIITYNPDNKRTLSANIKAYMEKATSIGAKPISCIRPQMCQNDLLSCYAKHGCDGRAAKRSKHTDGTACDWKGEHRGTLNRIIHNYSGVIPWHHGNEGGGVHDFTNNYASSNGNVAPNGGNGPEQKEPEPKPKPAAQPKQKVKVEQSPAPDVPRQPASGGTGTYEQEPSGRYKCPSGLRSICGSTADTRWCKQWKKNGHTAGCHP